LIIKNFDKILYNNIGLNTIIQWVLEIKNRKFLSKIFNNYIKISQYLFRNVILYKKIHQNNDILKNFYYKIK